MTDTRIDVPFQVSDAPLSLRVSLAACRLRVSPGGDRWATGVYADPSGRIPVTVVQEGPTVTISQSRSPADWLGVLSGVPTMDLALGDERPFALRLDAGAGDQTLDLSGLPLTAAGLRQGAGKLVLTLSTPNPVPMSELTVGVGAGAAEVTGLGNARAGEIQVEGGAANCELDFGGALLGDCRLRVSTGMAAVRISIPPSTATEITAEAMLGERQLPSDFSRQGNTWRNTLASENGAPSLRIVASVALGSLLVQISAAGP